MNENIMIGQTVSHYKIVEKLGEGGMSQNGPHASLARGCHFEDPVKRSEDGRIL